jgi:hypothetical protein
MAKAQRTLAKEKVKILAPNLSKGGGGDITVELKNGSMLVIAVPMEESGMEESAPKLKVMDCHFLLESGIVQECKEVGCLHGWVKTGVKVMEYTPEELIECTQDITPDGTAFIELTFLEEAWDDLYRAIVLIHRESLKI